MRTDILTVSGNYFNFLHPYESKISIHDIAHGLSHICRFAGHTKEFYSVAQHSWMVSHWVSQENALAGLLHDAAEAYLGDVTRPLKALLPDYQAIEKRVQSRILNHFGLSATLPHEIKAVDLMMLATEQRDLMPHHDDQWAVLNGIEPLPAPIVPLTASEAKDVFLTRFASLWNNRS